jgi:hypothetical protein
MAARSSVAMSPRLLLVRSRGSARRLVRNGLVTDPVAAADGVWSETEADVLRPSQVEGASSRRCFALRCFSIVARAFGGRRPAMVVVFRASV